MNAYDVYKIYLTVKAHMNTMKFDLKKIASTKCSVEAFNKRNDGYMFKKIGERLNNSDEVRQYFIANFLKDPKFWIGNDGWDAYFRMLGRLASLDRTIAEDLDNILELIASRGISFDDLIRYVPGKHPGLMRLFLSEIISPEAASMLFMGLRLDKMWDNSPLIQDHIYIQMKMKLIKYGLLLDVNKMMLACQPQIIALVSTKPLHEAKTEVQLSIREPSRISPEGRIEDFTH
ncbi:MAG TPA: hypothetical protein VIJ14_05780 [Rhabdochlamydiaceae bacterium]